jgi:hypothetical protein
VQSVAAGLQIGCKGEQNNWFDLLRISKVSENESQAAPAWQNVFLMRGGVAGKRYNY